MSIKNQWVVGATMLFALAQTGCGSPDRGADAGAVSASAPMSGEAANMAGTPKAELASFKQAGGSRSPSAPAPPAVKRSIIRRGDVAVRVENVEKAEKEVGRIVESIGGYVDSAQSTDLASSAPTIDITLRVPVEQFDSALEKFEKLGVRLSKQISSEDVTGQIVDLDARLKTLSAEEETYRNMLRRTSEMKNVIMLQERLTDVRGQIESMTGQRKALAGMAALSPITVHLTQNLQAVQAPSDPNWLSQTWAESTTNLGSAFRGATVLGIWILVFSPFWVPGLLILRWLVRSTPARVVPPPPPRSGDL